SAPGIASEIIGDAGAATSNATSSAKKRIQKLSCTLDDGKRSLSWLRSLSWDALEAIQRW
ncbi:unnamed protein product, partial [Amoebophrya sp. A25]